MYQTTVMLFTDCDHPECKKHYCRADPCLELELQYTDKEHDIDLSIEIYSPLTVTISNMTKELLEHLGLHDISPEYVRLVGYDRDGRSRPLNINDKQKTIQELDVTDGCILFFEPIPNAPPPKTYHLTIVGPDDVKTFDFEWYTAKTTLGMLLKFVIEKFSLQSIRPEQIHLITIVQELDIFAHSDKLLGQLHLYDKMNVFVKIIPSHSCTTVNENNDVHVQYTCQESHFTFDISNKATIGDIKSRIMQRIENDQIIDFELYNEANDELASDDHDRILETFGIKPGQTIRARFRLIPRNDQSSLVNKQSETSNKSLSASSNTKQKVGKVIIICEFPSNNFETFQVPVTYTVNQVMKQVDDHTGGQRLVISEMNSMKIKIDFKKEPERCLADLGFKDDDRITVTFNDKTRTHSSIVSKQVSTSPKLDKPSKPVRNTKVPIGLDNLGNSCYMNSALQCLAHVPQLTNEFLANIKYAHMNDGEHIDDDWNPYDQVGEVTGAYAELLWYLWKPNENGNNYDSFKPSRIREKIGKKDARFATDDQQDAQEFMTFFLDVIHEELKKKNKNQRDTMINELFFGEITATIRCTACNKAESRTQPINFLSIPLNRQERRFWINFISKKGKDELVSVDVPIDGRVENVVDEFSHSFGRPVIFFHILPMMPDGELDMKKPLSEVPTDELIFMEQQEKQRTDRPERLKLPEKKCTLEECLKEFFSAEALQDGWICQQEKCKERTIAIKQLKLSKLPSILTIQFKRFSHENGLHQKVETNVVYPIEGLDLKKCLSLSGEEAIYDLIAICSHMGSICGGHYTAYALHSTENKKEWYKFDDSSVTLVKQEDYNCEIVSRHAYLLFYMKRNFEITV